MRSYQRNPYADGVDSEAFDVDYIALLAIASVALQVYGMQEADKQGMDNVYIIQSLDKLLEKQEKMEGKLKRLERMIERGAYNGR